MSRTLLLTCTAALLALVAVVVGPPPKTNTVHTVARPGEEPAGVELPLASARDGVLTLEGKLSGAWVQAGPSEAFAWLSVRAARPEGVARRQPVSLALAIDRSGSMRGRKLTDAKQAARMLVQRLGPEDRLALVHYGTDVRVLPGQPVTEEARRDMLAFVDAIRDEGTTNISEALEEAARQLRPHREGYRVSRILLVSDGQPTAGRTEPEALLALARGYRAEGMAVSGLGVGEDFNERLMQGLAEQGGGFYGYLEDSERLAEVLGRELEQAAGTVARGVALRLELPEGVTGAEVLGVRAEREGRVLRVPLYDLAGGQEARVVVKLTLSLAAGEAPREVLRASLGYLDVEADRRVESPLALSARVTEDEALVRANLDREVRVQVSRALGARELQAAVQEMKRGNRQGALSLLDNARRMFGSSANALAGELADVDRTRAAYLGARDETAVKREALHLHRKTLKSFGQDNAY